MALPSPSYLHECFSYDPATGILTWKERPLNHFKSAGIQKPTNTKFAGKRAGWRHHKGYIGVTLDGRFYSAHRICWAIASGKWPTEIDHDNGDKADNRLENLRIATRQQNAWTRPRPERDLPRGVTLVRGTRFRATVKIGQKPTHIGYFDTPEEAHAAWRAHIAKARGEFLRED